MSETTRPAPLLPLQTFVAPRAKRHALPLADWPAADQAAWQRAITPASLLERADLCMFAAKRAGRNRTLDDATTADLVAAVA